MNFTLDDAASQLVYSSDWAFQSPTDPNLSQFFDETYHVAQTSGATLNMTVQGSLLYIYGSKGPSHVRPLPTCQFLIPLSLYIRETSLYNLMPRSA